MRPAPCIVALLVTAPLFAPPAGAQGASFQGLGDLPGGANSSAAFGVSPDGIAIVGSGVSSSGSEAFLWTQAGGMQGLGDLPGDDFQSWAQAVANGGTVVVGVGTNANGDDEAFRWSQGEGMQGLGTFDPSQHGSEARGVTANGATVVGFADQLLAQNEAFRWTTGTGLVGLGFLTNAFDSGADDVSSDGAVVVGWAEDSEGRNRPVRWSGGIQILGDLPGGDVEGEAWGVSGDGSVAVGHSSSAAGPDAEAFRWSAAGGMVGLGFLDPAFPLSYAYGASGNGEVVVGEAAVSNGRRAFIWTPDQGMRDLKTVLENEHGLDLTGWTLTHAYDVSDDGTVIVGTGIGPTGNEAWRAVLPSQCEDTAALTLRTWLNTSGGAFSQGANWTDGEVPGTSDIAAFLFPEGINYTVAFSTDHLNDALSIDGGNDVGFVLGGRTYALSGASGCRPSLRVEGALGSAGLLIQEGTVRAENGLEVEGEPGTRLVIGSGATLDASGTVRFGGAAGSSAEVRVEAGGVMSVIAAGSLVVGGDGEAAVNVFAGGQVALLGTPGVLVAEGSGSAVLQASGQGAHMTLFGVAVVGHGGTGALVVNDDAGVVASRLVLARLGGSTGVATVRDFAVLEASELRVGVEGGGAVTIADNGAVLVSGDLLVPAGAGSGLLDVHGLGSLVRARRLRLGTEGAGTLRISEAGLVEVETFVAEGQATLNMSGGCLRIANAPCGGGALRGTEAALIADTVWVSPGADFDSTAVALGPGGVLGGGGTMELDLINSGALSPGDSAGVAGTFTIAGAYTQAPAGALEIELGGNAAGAYDRLAVTGVASLDGTLRFSHIGGFTPAPGDVFEVLTAASVGAAFAGVEGPPGCTYSLSYGPTTVTATVLTVAAEPPAGATALVLHAPAPNPATGPAIIRYELPAAGHVRLAVYDALGREVAVLIESDRPAGRGETMLEVGALAPGAYIARLATTAGSAGRPFTVTR